MASPTRPALAVVVLAAGAGSRFSGMRGAKLLAALDGRPVLEHVLTAARAITPAITVVVLGHGAGDIERAIAWADEVRVHNPRPGDGISSSIRVGFDRLRAAADRLDGAFVVLGDQPRLRPAVLRALAAASTTALRAGRPVLVPRYEADPGPRNPVLLMRAAWPLIDTLQGDYGLAPLLDAHPELVHELRVPGDMPDVDRRADLESAGGAGGGREGPRPGRGRASPPRTT